MTNVINLKERIQQRNEIKRPGLITKCNELKQEVKSAMEGIIIPHAPSWVNSHTIPNTHWREGRVLYVNCPKGSVPEFLFRARGQGYLDFVVEETALENTPEGVRVLEGQVAIYARREL